MRRQFPRCPLVDAVARGIGLGRAGDIPSRVARTALSLVDDARALAGSHRDDRGADDRLLHADRSRRWTASPTQWDAPLSRLDRLAAHGRTRLGAIATAAQHRVTNPRAGRRLADESRPDSQQHAIPPTLVAKAAPRDTRLLLRTRSLLDAADPVRAAGHHRG